MLQPGWSGPLGEPVPPGSGAGFALDGVEAPQAPAGRITLAVGLGERDRLEVRGTWLGARTSSGRVRGVLGHTEEPGGALQTTAERAADLRVTSEAAGAEVAWRRALGALRGAPLEGQVGVRGLLLTEQAQLASFSQPLQAGFEPEPRVDLTVRDVLVALQGGAALDVPLGARWHLLLEAEGFVGVALREARTRDAALFAPGEHTVTLRDSALACGGALEVGLRWQLGERVALHAAYEGTLVAGLARLSGALDATRAGSGSVRPRLSSETLWLHAIHLGVSLDL